MNKEMSRPGFVLRVDDRTPPLLVPEGSGCRLQRFAQGTAVVYPSESMPVIADLRAGIDEALAAPQGGEPLDALLRPGMKLTLTFTSSQVPASRNPDIRGRIIERVLTLAAQAGVDDVALVAANGLGPRPTDSELRGMLGERIVRSFLGQGLLGAHDAYADTAAVGGVSLNARVAESDLVVHVAVVDAPGRDAGSQLVTGLGSAEVIGRARSLEAVRNPGIIGGLVDQVAAALPLFVVEAVLDQRSYPPGLAWLGRREWEWTTADRARFFGLRRLQSVAGRQMRRSLVDQPVERQLVGLTAGQLGRTSSQTAQILARQQQVPIDEPFDVVVTGVPAHTVQNPDGELNPLVAAWSALVDTVGSHTGRSAVRDGGVVVVFAPFAGHFSARTHPSASDFYADVLSQTTDPDEIARDHESRFADDEWYRNLYRSQHAFAGAHPVHLWYEIAEARARLGDVIVVGGDRDVVERLGFRAASTFEDALEIAAASVGRTPSVGYLHTPPRIIAEVSGQDPQ